MLKKMSPLTTFSTVSRSSIHTFSSVVLLSFNVMPNLNQKMPLLENVIMERGAPPFSSHLLFTEQKKHVQQTNT